MPVAEPPVEEPGVIERPGDPTKPQVHPDRWRKERLPDPTHPPTVPRPKRGDPDQN